MKKLPLPFIVAALAILAGFSAFLIWGIPYFFRPFSFVSGADGYGSQVARALVTEIIEQGQVEMGGASQNYQVMRVKLLEGNYKDVLLEVDYGKRQLRPDATLFSTGDEIYVTIDKRPDGVLVAYYVDYVRTNALLLLAGVFVLAILVMGRRKGLGALLALVFSMLMIVGYVIPHILSGEDPLRVSLIGSAILLGTTLYMTYGWNLKTHASVLSMVLALLLTGALTVIFVSLARLNGFGDENALFLTQISSIKINLRGLLLGGMIIGALGVLDDLVTSQSAAVFEIYDANPALGFRRIYEKAMRIGQDHVAATVNTLVLAYTGASLPLLLLFALGSGNYGFLLNVEFMAEEVVRTLVGSLGLMAAVPIASFTATALVLYADRLGQWRMLLGPAIGSGENSHHH
jgi:uncharacterized membrane protein